VRVGRRRAQKRTAAKCCSFLCPQKFIYWTMISRYEGYDKDTGIKIRGLTLEFSVFKGVLSNVNY
jgi:hypothetical protein